MGHPEIYAYMMKEISHNLVKYESSTNYFIIIIFLLIFCIGGFLERDCQLRRDNEFIQIKLA